MFENLSERIEGAFKSLKGQGKITELNVAETIKEVRKALVEADVNYKIAKEFTDRVREKAMGANVLTSLQPGQVCGVNVAVAPRCPANAFLLSLPSSRAMSDLLDTKNRAVASAAPSA